MGKRLTVVVVLLVMIIAAYGIYRYNQQPPSVENMQPVVQVSAEALVQAYLENETAANNNYLGKTIQVTGVVNTVQPGVGVSLKGGAAQNVSCSFETSSTAQLPAAGQAITVRGVCTGYLIDVELNRCVQIK